MYPEHHIACFDKALRPTGPTTRRIQPFSTLQGTAMYEHNRKRLSNTRTCEEWTDCVRSWTLPLIGSVPIETRGAGDVAPVLLRAIECHRQNCWRVGR